MSLLLHESSYDVPFQIRSKTSFIGRTWNVINDSDHGLLDNTTTDSERMKAPLTYNLQNVRPKPVLLLVMVLLSIEQED